MGPVRTLEKIKVDGETVRFRQLGRHFVEFVTSDRKKELQQTLCKTIDNTGYTDEVEHTSQGNITCRLLPKGKMTFRQLIEKIVNLIVRGIKRFDKKMDASRRHSRRKEKRQKQYVNHKAIATT